MHIIMLHSSFKHFCMESMGILQKKENANFLININRSIGKEEKAALVEYISNILGCEVTKLPPQALTMANAYVNMRWTKEYSGCLNREQAAQYYLPCDVIISQYCGKSTELNALNGCHEKILKHRHRSSSFPASLNRTLKGKVAKKAFSEMLSTDERDNFFTYNSC